MTNTCDTCKHWDSKDSPLPWNGRRQCRLPDTSKDDQSLDDGFGADGGDGSDCVYTGPKFGCIHHESIFSKSMIAEPWNPFQGMTMPPLGPDDLKLVLKYEDLSEEGVSVGRLNEIMVDTNCFRESSEHKKPVCWRLQSTDKPAP